MQQFKVYQSLWAMERRHTDGREPTLQQNLERIHAAGYDGVSFNVANAALAHEVDAFCTPRGLGWARTRARWRD